MNVSKTSIGNRLKAAILCVVVLCAFFIASCSAETTMTLKNEKGKTVGEIDQKLMSLIMSVSNSQLGVDAYTGTDIWEMKYQEGSDKTVKDVVVAQAKAYAEGLLQAEYLCDNEFGSGLSKEQISFVDDYINELKSMYGEKVLENTLSAYGTDTEALKRYMLLVLKRDAVYKALYSAETGLRLGEVQTAKKSYFEEKFVIEDHILLKYSGGVKDDGTEIPLNDEQKAEKLLAAKMLYDEIVNGVRDFDEALAEFGEDTYILGFPFGYFVSKDFDWSGMPSEVQSGVREMKDGEIRFIETESGVYIVRRNPMNSELYASNGSFDLYLESIVAQDDFLLLCEGAGSVSVNEELFAELDPKNIPSFNMSLLGQE